jgi:DNA-binding HxlR family transcriptional regulator
MDSEALAGVTLPGWLMKPHGAIRRPPIASAEHGLRLLRPELNRDILTLLANEGSQPLFALVALAASPSTLREHLSELIEAGVVVEGGTPRAREHSLPTAGSELVKRIQVVVDWLGSDSAPDMVSPATGWRIFGQMGDTWSGVRLEWIARCRPGPADLDEGFPGVSGRQLKEEFKMLRLSGLIVVGKDGRYSLSPWGAEAIGVLAEIARWEQDFLPEIAAPIEPADATVAMLAALPILRLPEHLSGLCTLSAEAEAGGDGSAKVAAVWAEFRHGRVVKLAEGRPPRPADAWVSGPFSAWLSAVLDGRLRALNCAGKDGYRELAEAVVAELHARLTGFRTKRSP